MEKILKKLIPALCCILSCTSISLAQVSIAFDPVDAYGLRREIFGPFVALGKVPVSENTFLSHETQLPVHIPAHWQVISVGKDILLNECSEHGKLMSLDLNTIPHKELLVPSAIEPCGIGYSVSGTVLAYSVLHKYGAPPNSWSDFFDTGRYPGKRSLPKNGRHIMEIALLADGVEKDELYKVLTTSAGKKRALDKLSSIYNEIIWWDNINDLQTWLTEGIVSFAIAPDGAILHKEGLDSIGISRNEVIYRMHYYAIPKSANNLNLAYAFISFATQPTQQQNFASTMLYGTTLKQGWTLISPEKQIYLTNYPKNLQNGILEDYEYYAREGSKLEEEFQTWLTSKDIHIKRVTISIKENNTLQAAPTTDEFIGPHPFSEETGFIGPLKPIPENQQPEKAKHNTQVKEKTSSKTKTEKRSQKQ